jgi:hypothetical protein
MGCEPNVKLTIQNNTNTTLNIFVDLNYIHAVSTNLGYVEPGQFNRRQFLFPWEGTRFIYVQAKNAKGDVIYFRKYSLDEVSALRYKITITEDPPWFTG